MFIDKRHLEEIEFPVPDIQLSREVSLTESEASRRDEILQRLKEREQTSQGDLDLAKLKSDIRSNVKARKENFLKYYKTLDKDKPKDHHTSVEKRKASMVGSHANPNEKQAQAYSPTMNKNAKGGANFKRKSFQDQQNNVDPSFIGNLQETKQKQRKELAVHKLSVPEIEERYRDILDHSRSSINIDKDSVSVLTVYYRDDKKERWVPRKVEFPAEKQLKDLKVYVAGLVGKRPAQAFKFKGPLIDDDESSVSSSDLIDEDESKPIKALDGSV